MILKLLSRDILLWGLAGLCALAVAGASAVRDTSPGSEGGAPLSGRSVAPARHEDPHVAAVMNGAFPKVDSQLTLAQAFARYRWFDGAPKWIGQGPAASRTVLVSAPLRMPLEAVRLGAGSSAARAFYVAQFALSADMKSFKPIDSAVEVRDGANKLVARVPDPEYILVRRVMRGVEPGVSLSRGIANGK